MKLTDQVTSLEISQKLDKLGVKQESFLYHTEHGITPGIDVLERDRICSAFTTAELGEIMKNYPFRLPQYNGMSWYSDEEHIKFEETDTEANARGMMLAYIIEHSLLTLK